MNGCYAMWDSNTKNKSRSSSDREKDCNNLCQATQGMENNDLNSCAKSEGILRDTCYSDIAEKRKDSQICAKISDNMFISACYANLAKILKDPKLCENVKVSLLKDGCLSEAK